MPRFILIDNASGYIWGDTADLPRTHVMRAGEWAGHAWDAIGDGALTPIEAARWLDETLGEYGREYDEVGRRDLASNETGYLVYRADVGGSEAVPVIQDGQDQETIDAVLSSCKFEAAIRVLRAGD